MKSLMKVESERLFDAAKDNFSKLKGCQKHVFGAVLGSKTTTGEAIGRCCLECDGAMSDRDILNYMRGYSAAGGDPDEIATCHDGSSYPLAD